MSLNGLLMIHGCALCTLRFVHCDAVVAALAMVEHRRVFHPESVRPNEQREAVTLTMEMGMYWGQN